MTSNEVRSHAIIHRIDRNKHLDLTTLAKSIEDDLKSGNRDIILTHFNRLIDIDHATLYGLGTTHHIDRTGGWGFGDRDDKFLSSLRGRHLSHVYGVMHGSGRYVLGPLSVKQVAALARCLARPFYTLQLALIVHGD